MAWEVGERKSVAIYATARGQRALTVPALDAKAEANRLIPPGSQRTVRYAMGLALSLLNAGLASKQDVLLEQRTNTAMCVMGLEMFLSAIQSLKKRTGPTFSISCK